MDAHSASREKMSDIMSLITLIACGHCAAAQRRAIAVRSPDRKQDGKRARGWGRELTSAVITAFGITFSSTLRTNGAHNLGAQCRVSIRAQYLCSSRYHDEPCEHLSSSEDSRQIIYGRTPR
eukprot:3931604-Rhodomonas_salina.1